ncbi:MAG: glycosyltransferase family 9 protein [Gemmatimonas sp.]
MSERILVVKIAALGDAVMASTIVPAIRRRWPNATIGWVAGRGIAPLVRLVDGIDEVIEVDDRALLGGNRVSAITAMLRAWKSIGIRWDRAIIAHTDARYAWLARFSGARTVTRFAGENARRKGHWYGTEYRRLVEGNELALNGVSEADTLPPFKLSLLPAAPVVSGSGPLVLVAPGGARNLLRDDHLRRWPISNWVATVRKLIALGYRVAAIGGKGDVEECAQVAAVGAVNLCDRTSLPELLALLQSAQLVITHDSGPLHLAIGLRRPVIALFGPTSPLEFVPDGANVTVITRAQEMSCAPCYDGACFAPCAANQCLARVPNGDVVRAAQAILAREFTARSQVHA